jgi:hypothetical protein
METRLTRDRVSKTVMGLCQIYDKTTNPLLFEVWFNVVCELSVKEFEWAVKEYMIRDKSRFMPLPGQIYSLARPEVDRDGEAQLLADRIFYTLGPCGENDSAIAKEKLNDVQWAYIQNIGGWSTFARDMQLTSDDMAILKSQARRAILNLLVKNKAGKSLLLDDEPELKQLGDSIKKLLPTGVLKRVECD